MNFLFDEQMPVQVARAFRELGKPVTHLYDASGISRGAPDDQVLRFAGEYAYRIITIDRRLYHTPQYHALILSQNIGLYFLVPRNKREYQPWDLVEILVKNWTEIERHADQTAPPYTMLVRRTGIRSWRGERPAR